MRRKVVITGAAGFIGSQLGLHLHRNGFDVHLLDNLRYGYRENLTVDGETFGTFHEKDIRDADLASVFDGADTVFHLAAISALPVCQSEPFEAISVNVGGTANVLEAARLASVRRVIVASTSAVYENSKHFPCREDDEISPTLLYSVSKQQTEQLSRSFWLDYELEVVVTRYYNVYGPQQDIRRKSPPFVGYVIREILAGNPPVLHSNGAQRRDYVYVDDVVSMNVACMDHPAAPGEIFNVASGRSWSVAEMYTVIADLLGSPIEPVYRSADLFWDKYNALFTGPKPLKVAKLAAEVDKFSLGQHFPRGGRAGMDGTHQPGGRIVADGIAHPPAHERRTCRIAPAGASRWSPRPRTFAQRGDSAADVLNRREPPHGPANVAGHPCPAGRRPSGGDRHAGVVHHSGLCRRVQRRLSDRHRDERTGDPERRLRSRRSAVSAGQRLLSGQPVRRLRSSWPGC